MLKTKIQEKIPDFILQINENQIKRWENTVEKVSFNGDTFGFVSFRDVTWYTKVWAIICQSLIFIVCLLFLSGESSSSSTSSSSAGSQLPLGAGAAAKPKQGKCLV